MRSSGRKPRHVKSAGPPLPKATVQIDDSPATTPARPPDDGVLEDSFEGWASGLLSE